MELKYWYFLNFIEQRKREKGADLIERVGARSLSELCIVKRDKKRRVATIASLTAGVGDATVNATHVIAVTATVTVIENRYIFKLPPTTFPQWLEIGLAHGLTIWKGPFGINQKYIDLLKIRKIAYSCIAMVILAHYCLEISPLTFHQIYRSTCCDTYSFCVFK